MESVLSFQLTGVHEVRYDGALGPAQLSREPEVESATGTAAEAIGLGLERNRGRHARSPLGK